MPTARERAGDFSATTNAPAAGRSSTIRLPACRSPATHPVNRINPVAAKMLKYLPCPTPTWTTAASTTTGRRSQVEVDAGIHGQGRTQIHRQGVADRLLSLQPVERAVRELFRLRRPERSEPLRRSARLHPGAAAENPGAEQHVRAERHTVLALRFGFTRFPDNNTLTLPFDPIDARILAELPEPDHAAEIPAGADPWLRHASRPTLGAINPTQIDWKSTSANAAFSKFVGTHTVEDRRRLPADRRRYLHSGQRRRVLRFRQGHTSAIGVPISAQPTATRWRRFCSGYPSGESPAGRARFLCRVH